MRLTSAHLAGRYNQPRPPSPSSHLSLNDPFTRKSLTIVRSLLENAKLAASKDKHWKEPATAAVLVPVCNVDDRAGVLLEVRGKLRTHSGEISFPGGKVDEADGSSLTAALRETWEELGIHPEQVEVLAEMDLWRERSSSGLTVTPYIGFVSPMQAYKQSNTCCDPLSSDSSLPSLSLSSLRPSPKEVAHVFHLPFEDLLNPSRLRAHLFRDLRPYWAVDVTDKLNCTIETGPEAVEELGRGKGGPMEVWGLTGWYLSLLMRTIGAW